ncbi:hypothetical protein B0T16DRAFT_398649 [Cercophora newfieldiana]|uniref:Uncharacterized protein n=1 Tax=Cercophora newfieldiana TaxID=92897 RepID=A0AA40D0K5_9PEZI|nr:hypothetical protein B0T16DRAFT_398649 [Cercophora newfieldiana]
MITPSLLHLFQCLTCNGWQFGLAMAEEMQKISGLISRGLIKGVVPSARPHLASAAHTRRDEHRGLLLVSDSKLKCGR